MEERRLGPLMAGSDGRPTAASEKQNLNGSFLAVNLKVSISVPDPEQPPRKLDCGHSG